MECQGVKGEPLAWNIEDTLVEDGAMLENFRGQGYDYSSAMSSKSKGVFGRILKNNPEALYVHCSSNRLSLVDAKAWKLPTVKQMFRVTQKLSSSFYPFFHTNTVLKEENG